MPEIGVSACSLPVGLPKRCSLLHPRGNRSCQYHQNTAKSKGHFLDLVLVKYQKKLNTVTLEILPSLVFLSPHPSGLLTLLAAPPPFHLLGPLPSYATLSLSFILSIHSGPTCCSWIMPRHSCIYLEYSCLRQLHG